MKSYILKVKFLSKIPISGKSIIKKVNSSLKSGKFSENPEKIIYIEFIKKQSISYYRIFIIPNNYWEKFKMLKQDSNIEIVLENPEDKEEIKDFLRLCYIFNLPLNILTNKNITNLINKAKEEAKGIPYEKFALTQNLRDKLDYSFRLTKETKKPLRASHALSYVLGLID